MGDLNDGGDLSDGDRDTRRYLIAFAALVALTALELGTVGLDAGRAARITALCGLAMAKVGTLLLVFMHLRTESRALRLMAALPLVVAPAFTIIVMLDAVYRVVWPR